MTARRAEALAVTPVARFEGRLLPKAFSPTAEQRAEIAAVFASAKAAKPDIYDGPLLLARDIAVEGGVLSAAYVRTTFATLLWRRSLGFPAGGLGNVFAAAVVVSSDGAALLGRMAPMTANAGGLYFPCGTPDPSDVVDGRVDLEGSIARELLEETGLEEPLVVGTERRVAIFDGALVACLRRFDSPLSAEALGEAARRHIANDREAELDAFVLVRSAADLTDASPAYVHAGLPALLAAR